MSRVRSKDTAPELIVRKQLHAMGFRFRLHQRSLPGSPDIVLARHKKIVLVHGCFWHAHGCKIGKAPKSNEHFWIAKLGRNRVRDAENLLALKSLGWDVLTVWQCETRDKGELQVSLREFISAERTKNSDRQESPV